MQKASFLQDSWRSQKTSLLIALLVLVADQLTKLWVSTSLLLGESWPQEGFMRFTHVNNEGIIFGLLAPKLVTIILPILVIAVALILAYRYAPFNKGLIAISLGLFIGGNIGNLIDRIRHGYVTDFFDFNLWGDYHWPTFNVADIAIVIGVFFIIWFLVRLGIFAQHD